MLVLCQSGMVVILIITALTVLCFGFVSKAVLTVSWLLLSSACTSIKAFSISCSVPLSKWGKGSEWGCGCSAVGMGHPTRVQPVGSWVTASPCLRSGCLCQRWLPCQVMKGAGLWWACVQCSSLAPVTVNPTVLKGFQENLFPNFSIRGWAVCFLQSSFLPLLKRDVKFTFFCLQKPICDCHTLSNVIKNLQWQQTAVPVLLNAPHQVSCAGLSDS